MRYRRAQVPGGTFFFTVVTHQRARLLCDGTNPELIDGAFEYANEGRPFRVDAFVLLPDHLHCIRTLPEGDGNFSTRWRLIKAYFSRRCKERLAGRLSGVWQPRFWEHTIRDDRDFKQHVDYIHYNPVKHGLVSSPRDWPYSTFHEYASRGLYDIDWGAGGADRIPRGSRERMI